MQFKKVCPSFEILRNNSFVFFFALFFFPLLGVYTAAHNLQTEWVVVKGISDYPDGTKDSTKDWKLYASVMAASLVAHVLSQPSIVRDWPRYDGGSKCS